MFAKLQRSVVVLSLAPTFHVLAQPFVTQLDPVVVVGERSAPLSETLASVMVIDRAQIEAAHVNDISELLQGLAGIEVSRPGPPGSPISVYIRGGASTHALVMLDGIPFFSESATGSSSPLEAIALDQVDKIEIVPGGMPNVRGFIAPGGIISITTRTASAGTDSQQYSAMLGSRSTSSLSAFRRWNWESTRISLDASRQYTGGFGAINPVKFPAVNPGNNPFMRNTVSMGLSTDLSANTQLGANFMQTTADSSWDNAWANTVKEDWLSRSKSGFTGVYLQSQLTPSWYARWDVQQSQVQSTTLTDEVVNVWYGTYTTKHNVVSWRNEFQLNPRTLLKAGISQDRTNYYYSYTPLDQNQNRLVTFLGLEQKVGKGLVTLDLGRSSGLYAQAYTNRGLGAMHPLTSNVSLMAQHNVTYRMPTIGELLDPASGGNADLKAERIKSSQIALQFKGEHDLHRLTWFNSIYANKVAAGNVPVDDAYWANQGVNKLENLNASHNAGLEWYWRHQHQAWTWITSYTVQQPQVDGASTLLKNLSHQFGSVDVAYRLSSGDALSLKWYARSSQYNTKPRSGDDFSAGYAVTKLGWSRPLSPATKVQVSIDNLFDKRYESVAGYNAPPIGAFVTLSHSPQR